MTAPDIDQLNQCRRPHNRLGFGYQLSFVRLFNRFPAQQPFELINKLLTFVGVQLAVDVGLITHYQHRRQTISEHQQRITKYLQQTPFGETEAKLLEAFVFEESCRLEQTAALESRVQEFLKEQKILQPADSTVARIIGEQRKLARENIFEKIAAGVPTELAKTLDDLDTKNRQGA